MEVNKISRHICWNAMLRFGPKRFKVKFAWSWVHFARFCIVLPNYFFQTWIIYWKRRFQFSHKLFNKPMTTPIYFTIFTEAFACDLLVSVCLKIMPFNLLQNCCNLNIQLQRFIVTTTNTLTAVIVQGPKKYYDPSNLSVNFFFLTYYHKQKKRQNRQI